MMYRCVKVLLVSIVLTIKIVEGVMYSDDSLKKGIGLQRNLP
jgi:hypothetical protein